MNVQEQPTFYIASADGAIPQVRDRVMPDSHGANTMQGTTMQLGVVTAPDSRVPGLVAARLC
jgi:hypothetical protein